MIKRKYHNKPKVRDGIHFDSTLEGRCWSVLKNQLAKGKIADLRRQVDYTLLPAIDDVDPDTGEAYHQEPVRYRADFVFTDVRTGKEIVMDAKGHKTKEYELKRKMMRALLGITIREVYKASMI